MAFHIRSVTPEEFEAWLGHMKSKGPKPPAAPAAAAPSAADSLRTASAGAKVQGPSQAAPQDSAAGGASPARGPDYAAGEKLFLTKGCVGCHSLQAVGAPKGLIGPNLANVGSREYIAAGWLRNTDANLERWIREPQSVKKGVLMPNLGVTAEEARGLRAYLRAHQ
jgi:cytochrome c1